MLSYPIIPDEAEDEDAAAALADSPPAVLVVVHAALIVPAVILCFSVLHHIWLTYFALFSLWVLGPIAACHYWAGAQQRALIALSRGLHRWRLQAPFAVASVPLLTVTLLASYHFLAAPLHISDKAMQPALGSFGLLPSTIGLDVISLLWLTLVNPVMEECFWRIYVFEMLRQPAPGKRRSTWWAPALASAALYASYHVPVVANFLRPSLCALAYVGLVGLGLLLQLIVEHVGVLVAIGVHTAADAAASLIASDIIWRWGLANRL